MGFFNTFLEKNASVAETEYAQRLGRCSRKGLEVQILSEAHPTFNATST